MRNGWRVAVVMPAFNEEAQIESAIQSVPSWVDSLVVVDDGSTDMTYQQAKSVLPEFGKIVRTTGLGVGGA
ncbi:MAG TPA: glycosyltransferase, partial [Candidatus Poseidoniales archaeon]|nr:glycosyltransferase [Candidatus Poseidoniales archaeon]